MSRAAEAREAQLLDPSDAIAYSNLASDYVALGRLADAKSAIDDALRHHLDSSTFHVMLYVLAFLNNDITGMQQQLAFAKGKPDIEDVLLSQQSGVEAYFGRLHKARALSQQAVVSAKGNGKADTAGFWLNRIAWIEALYGNSIQARQAASAALALSNAPELKYNLAEDFAEIGDVAQAQKLVNEIDLQAPLNTILQRCWLPTIRAQIELVHGNPARAVQLLESVIPYELGQGLDPAYIRGQAYLALRQGSAAMAEFQKILEHRGVVLESPTGALAHLQLGRAKAMTGDRDGARKAYEEFLTLWKGADPEIPILKQAKAEYAKL
jgi:tetratricopeptide (TPR) repeat protein